jgi:hypothetical protein
MTSAKQIENRRNSLSSTGPKTDLGKQRASQNAVRHGLTAETIIVPLEDADDYQAFELAVTADYEAEIAVERELVLRLASLLWRLRAPPRLKPVCSRFNLKFPMQETELAQDSAVATLGLDQAGVGATNHKGYMRGQDRPNEQHFLSMDRLDQSGPRSGAFDRLTLMRRHFGSVGRRARGFVILRSFVSMRQCQLSHLFLISDRNINRINVLLYRFDADCDRDAWNG